MEKEDFIMRLVNLRMGKNVSARDMSLSLGQSPNYINGIENGGSYPSMTMFFYICDYLGITPRDFFDLESTNPSKAQELLEVAKSLPNDQLELLIALAISGLTNPLAAMVQRQLNNLRGCEAHFSVIISEEDRKLYKRLGINVSCEPKYEVKKLYHK